MAMSHNLWSVLIYKILILLLYNLGYSDGYVPMIDWEVYDRVTQSELSLLFPIEEITGKRDSLTVSTVFRSQALLGTDCGEQIETIFQCIFHTHQTPAEEEAHKLRSFRIIDSWGKVEPGVAQGNLNWLGRPSQCDVTYQVEDGPRSYTFSFLSSIVRFKMTGVDPTNPMEARIFLGFCLPDGCHATHILKLFNVSGQNVTLLPEKVTLRSHILYFLFRLN